MITILSLLLMKEMKKEIEMNSIVRKVSLKEIGYQEDVPRLLCEEMPTIHGT